MGNKNCTTLEGFNFMIIKANFEKNKYKKIFNTEEGCPLDIFFDPKDKDCKIKLLNKNLKGFEIYGLDNIILHHSPCQYTNDDFVNSIEQKINKEKKKLLLIIWKIEKNTTIQSETDYKISWHNFRGKELKNFFIGLGSIASEKSEIFGKKYTFLPTNNLCLRYNKFIIYDDECRFLYNSYMKQNFSFEKTSNYMVLHIYKIKE